MSQDPSHGIDDLDHATLPTPVPGRTGSYRIELTKHWNAPVVPQGGVVSAVALRAMEHALGNPRHTLHSSTTVFASQVGAGPTEIDVEVLRSGRNMSQCVASVRNSGSDEAGHRVIAVFGEPRGDGVEFTQLQMPKAPPPEECPGPAEPPEGYPTWPDGFFNRVELRRVRAFAGWESDWEGGRAESIRWLRLRQPPRDDSGRLPLWAMPCLSDSMPNAVGQYMGPGQRRFMAPSCDLTLHYFEAARDGDWILLRNQCRRAHGGYASADNEMWSSDGRLLAYATQTMFLRMNPKV